MLDAVTAAAIKVAVAAGGAAGWPDILCYMGQIYLFDWPVVFDFKLAAGYQGILIGRVAGTVFGFQVGCGGVMAGQAVHILFNAEIKILVFPAIADVARSTARIVGLEAAAKHVGDML